MVRVLVVDNYDSFVYNLVQYLGELGAEPEVYRPDEISVEAVEAWRPDALVISPGPGRPEDAKLSNAVIERLAGPRGVAGTVPILGVCLGHQCIGHVFGADVVRAPTVVHGKTSLISHHGGGVLAGLPDPFEATRYHSLLVDRAGLPDVLEVTAETADGLVMGLRHRELAVEGVQFHPESILTEDGRKLLANFLASADASSGN
jgi:anthranilate synthase/aminodeoxychorismate synthase-like glutamine amidotransferase